MKLKILAIDDEQDIRDILQYNLEKNGFEVFTAANGLEGLHKARKEHPDLLLLDNMMDGMDGNAVCRQLRADPEIASIPVIFLTAKGEEVDKVLGLELGADDYVTKPFSVRELISRIRAVLRRCGKDDTQEEQELIRCEELELNTKSKRVHIRGERINLTKKEYDILYLLLAHPGQVFSREQIKDNVWGEETYIVDRAIDVHVRRLRSKLDEYAKIIVTYPGVGYGYKI